MNIMVSKKWSVVGGESIENVFSDSGIANLTDDVEQGRLVAGVGFCDCEAADTEWTVLNVVEAAAFIQLTLKDAFGTEYVVIYQ
jgi:hypothetical protein